MRRKVGLDVDGVMANFSKAFRERLSRFTGVEYCPHAARDFDLAKGYGVSNEVVARVLDVMANENEWEFFEPFPEAIEAAQRIAEAHDVVIITGRKMHLVQATQRWLEKRGLGKLPLLCTDGVGRKGAFIQAENMHFDFFVEDNLDEAQGLVQAGVEVFLVDRPWNRLEQELYNTIRVKSLEEVACMIA